MNNVTFRDPKTGREQTFGAWEQTRQRLLHRIGWVLVEDEPTADVEPIKTTITAPLSGDFPAFDKLAEQGIYTVEALMNVEDLTALDGIGKATAAKIEAALQEL